MCSVVCRRACPTSYSSSRAVLQDERGDVVVEQDEQALCVGVRPCRRVRRCVSYRSIVDQNPTGIGHCLESDLCIAGGRDAEATAAATAAKLLAEIENELIERLRRLSSLDIDPCGRRIRERVGHIMFLLHAGRLTPCRR